MAKTPAPKDEKKVKGFHKKDRQKTEYQLTRDAAKKKKGTGSGGLKIANL